MLAATANSVASLRPARPAQTRRSQNPATISSRPSRQPRLASPPRALLDFLPSLFKKQREEAPSVARKRPDAVEQLLSIVEGTQRGVTTSPEQREAVLAAVAELKDLGTGSTTTDAEDLSATWRLVWTTEKETLFILEKAGLFGTAAGEVYQVVDVEAGTLQNVITFPPEGAFIVDSGISIEGPQRTAFRFSAATLKLPAGRKLRLPPFGKGWFDTIYMDDEIRVAQDSRGDTLVVARDGPPRHFD